LDCISGFSYGHLFAQTLLPYLFIYCYLQLTKRDHRCSKVTLVIQFVASTTEMTLIGRISDVVRSGRGPEFVA